MKQILIVLKVMTKYVWMFSFLLIFSNISQGQQISIAEFPIEKQISSSLLQVPPVLWNVQGMYILEDYLITYEKRDDQLFKIFSLPEGSLIKTFGQVGQGPNEVSSYVFNSFKRVNSTKPIIAYGTKGSTIRYHYLSDILEEVNEPYRTKVLPAECRINRSMSYVGDTVIIGAPYYLHMLLYKLNYSIKEVETFVDYPIDLGDMLVENKTNLFGCYTTVKPDNRKMAMTFGQIGEVKIYDFELDDWTTVSYKDFPSLEKNCALTKSNKPSNLPMEREVFCWEIRSSQNYIFLKVYDNKYTNVVVDGELNRDVIPEIHVFTWEGKPVARIKLDRFYHYFDIDKEEKNIYAIDELIEDGIIKFSLDGIL